MRGRASRRRANEGGQALVEFAFVLPILLLILVAILQFGLLFYNYIDLTSATRDGARMATVSRSNTDGDQAVRDAIAASTNVVRDGDTTVTISPAQPWSQGQTVSVKVTYPYELRILGVTFYEGPLSSESVARIE